MRLIALAFTLFCTLTAQAETYTMIVCPNQDPLPFPIKNMDSMDSRIRVGDTIQKKLEHLRELVDHVFFSTGMRDSIGLGSFVVTDHGQTSTKNFVIDRDPIFVYADVKNQLEQSKNQDPSALNAIIEGSNQQKVTMQEVLPASGQPTARYTFKNIYGCFTQGQGEMTKSYFIPHLDFYHNFSYEDLRQVEKIYNCSCYQVRM